MMCPHCHRHTLYAAADREAIGSCLSCGDIYQASITPAEARAEARRPHHPPPPRFTCNDCGWTFSSYAQREDHRRMWCNRSVASRSGQQAEEGGRVVGKFISGD